MTLATGKGGKYRYYKCNTKISKGVHLCKAPSIPMQKLDGIVLEALADQVFTPDRVETMLSEMRKQQRTMLKDQEAQFKPLQKEMDSLKLATDRLYEAVEKGLLPMDETLQQRAHKLQARRQEILIEIAGFRRQKEMPLDLLRPKQIGAFSKALRAKLLDRNSSFGKEYLKLLVNEIRIEGKQAQITGSYAALASAVAETKMGALDRVPRFVPNWLPDHGLVRTATFSITLPTRFALAA